MRARIGSDDIALLLVFLYSREEGKKALTVERIITRIAELEAALKKIAYEHDRSESTETARKALEKI
jgi:hypothetical protein